MKNAVVALRENIDHLSVSEHAVAAFILENPAEASQMSIQKLASKTFVSTSAVIRMCRTLGFEGYKEFRNSLIVQLALEDRNTVIENDLSKLKKSSDIARVITSNSIQSLQETMSLFDPETAEKCASLIRKGHVTRLFGLGASFITAKDFYLKLLRVNKTCQCDEDLHSQLISAKNSSSEDVAIIFSYSGQTSEMLDCLKILKENRTPVIAITRFASTPISWQADYVLYTSSNEALMRIAAMSSRLSQLMLVDILYTIYCSKEHDCCLRMLKKTYISKG